MLLKNLLNGEEASSFVILHDTIETSSKALLGGFITALLKRVDCIYVILFDSLPGIFLKAFTAELRTRIYCYDGFTDPLNWYSSKAEQERVDSNEPNYVHSDTDIASLISNAVCQRIQPDQNDMPLKIAIVIDCLDRMIHKSPANTCHVLNQLSRSKPHLGYQVSQLVMMVHSDLHDAASLEMINFVAQSLLWISPSSADEPSVLSDSDDSEHVESCRILHKRKSGKVLKKVQQYFISKDFDITEISEEDWNPKTAVQATYEPQQQIDPTSNLPFNLKLTEQERQARSQVKLPYMFHEQQNDKTQNTIREESKIFYQPDDADDFDDDDPDDDLDI